MLHRIFLAINLPQDKLQELERLQKTIPELPIRWIHPENLHITLVFVGNTSDKELEALQKNCRQVAKSIQPFSLQFSQVAYGPSPLHPRMVWLKGKPPKELLRLQRNLAAVAEKKNDFTADSKRYPFALHLTLGRLEEFELQTMELEELPDIAKDVSYTILVDSFDIMESFLKPKGAEYSIVESIRLEN